MPVINFLMDVAPYFRQNIDQHAYGNATASAFPAGAARPASELEIDFHAFHPKLQMGFDEGVDPLNGQLYPTHQPIFDFRSRFMTETAITPNSSGGCK